MDETMFNQAVAEADKQKPPPSTIDLAPKGALVIPPAALRLYEAASRHEEMNDEDTQLFVLWVAIEARAGSAARKRLWKLSRDPRKLVDAFQKWLWESDISDFTEELEEVDRQIREYDATGSVLEAPETPEEEGAEGNENGSPK